MLILTEFVTQMTRFQSSPIDFLMVAIEEMVRVLKPGGKVVVTDMDEHEFEFLRKEQHDRWLGFKREDIERWFRAAGLKIIFKIETK